MKRTPTPLLLAALLLVPAMPAAAQGAAPPVDYPEDLRALAPAWVSEAEAALAPHADAEWTGELQPFLEKARRERDEGRLRAATFDLETVHELLAAGQLMDEASSMRSDAERKSFVISRTHAMHAESERAWQAFRARLHGVEADLRSLHALEVALYAADVAATAKVNLDTYDALVPQFRTADFSRGAVLDLVRASRTPGLVMGYADDVLGVALAREGLPPELDVARWRETYVEPELARTENPGGVYEAWERIAQPVRQKGEGIMAVAIALAEVRAARNQDISLTFGDAESRGKDVVNDAAGAMARRLNRTSYDDVRPHGLLGVFTADAVDRARFVLDFHQQGKAQLAFLTGTWAALDHQERVALVLADVSPVEPERPTNLGEQNNLTRYPGYAPTAATRDDARTPGPGAALALAGVAAVALALGRRR